MDSFTGEFCQIFKEITFPLHSLFQEMELSHLFCEASILIIKLDKIITGKE
jgi:hypothetical protein